MKTKTNEKTPQHSIKIKNVVVKLLKHVGNSKNEKIPNNIDTHPGC